MLPSTPPRKALFLPWNVPSFTVEFTLSSSCFHSDLPPHDLVLWTDGSFPFDKGGSGIPANCSPSGTEATLSFSPAPVCSNFSAEVCAILARSLLDLAAPTSLLLFFSSYLTLVLSSLPSFLLPQTFWQELSSLSCSIKLHWVSGHSFLPGNDAAYKLARREALLAPSAIPCSFFTLVFSRTGGVLSHLNSSTRSFPRFPPRNLCSLVMLAVFSLVYAATTQPPVKLLSL